MESEILYHSVDAAHLRNIGEQSISNHVQAILELVKNAYDADAEHCTVTFHGTRFFNSPLKIEKITLEDNGFGMTYDDLKFKWLRVGTDYKKRNTASPLYGRRVSGEKGMGHYSAQRLGEKVRVVSNSQMYKGRTRSAHEGKTLVLSMDWLKYEPGKDFNKIGNALEIQGKEDKNRHGIKLEITELKDKWTYRDIEKVRMNLGNLMLPPELRVAKREQFIPELKTDGFELENSEVESSLLKFAPWKIESRLKDSMAHYIISKRGKKGNERIVLKRGKIPMGEAKCGDADLILYYYHGRYQEWAKGVMKPRILGDLLRQNCGIKIYMDGVRIMPYGERGNDWVELEKRKVRRYGGKVRNETVVGFIKLSHINNMNIKETTSRQALVENDAFMTLKNGFVLDTISELETLRQEYEEEQKEIKKKVHPTESAHSEIDHLTDYMEGWEISEGQKKLVTTKLSKISKFVTDQRTENERIEEELTSNLELYRNLSTVGLQALAFNHELMDPLSRTNQWLKVMKKRKDSLTLKQKNVMLDDCLNNIQAIMHWAQYIREFATLLSGSEGLKKKREPLDIKQCLNQLQKGFSDVFTTFNIDFRKSITGELPKFYFNRASLESIFINLITNSIRSLRRVDRKRVIKIEISKTSSYLKIRFTDNGLGIKDENYNRIFRPFFTTYTKTTDTGTGMGLTIVKEIVEDDYRGTIKLDSSAYENDEPKSGHATFLITIPLEKLGKPK